LSNPTQHPFRKSVRCDTGSCVEVAMGDEVYVRNSTAPDRVVTFSKEEWQVFVAGVRDGEFEAN
jgi:Domain of unknown function (DUF397)